MEDSKEIKAYKIVRWQAEILKMFTEDLIYKQKEIEKMHKRVDELLKQVDDLERDLRVTRDLMGIARVIDDCR